MGRKKPPRLHACVCCDREGSRSVPDDILLLTQYNESATLLS